MELNVFKKKYFVLVGCTCAKSSCGLYGVKQKIADAITCIKLVLQIVIVSLSFLTLNFIFWDCSDNYTFIGHAGPVNLAIPIKLRAQQ